MIAELLTSQEFQKLEKEYKFLSRARESVNELDRLPYVILDIETTGLDPRIYEVTEIAALKIENKEVKDVFNTLVKPRNPIPHEITELTGINDEMVEGQPAFKEIIPKFFNFINGANLVVHNVEFDIAFLNHHLNLNGRKIENTVLCSLKLSRHLLKNIQNHKLHTVAGHFGITPGMRHRALGDVETTFQIWFKLLELGKEKGTYSLEELKKIC